MPFRFVGDVSSEEAKRPPGSKNTPGVFPEIKRNGSQNGSDSASPSDWNGSRNTVHRSQSLSRSVSIATNKDSALRLPSIDRSKTNSICSYASSNITSVSSRNNVCKMPHLNVDSSGTNHDLNHNVCKENGEPAVSNHHKDFTTKERKKHRANTSQSEDRQRATLDVKLPDIFSCKSSTLSSPIQSPSPTFRHHSRMNKKKSSSMQDLAGQLRREDTIVSDSYKHFTRSPNSCLTVESQGYRRSESINSLPVRSSLPTPVLFPMVDNESRLSKKSKSSVKRREKQKGKENDDIKEVKLEVYSNVESVNEDKTPLMLSKANPLQKVREETEVDQYIYANGYDHHSKGHKGRKRAQSEDRRSAKVH